MSTDLVPTTDDLINLLDPARDYGALSYKEVVERVKDGRFILRQGSRLPQIYDATSNKIVKGSGHPVRAGTGETQQQFAGKEFRTRALDDFDDAYEELRKGMKQGDMRAHKIFWEMLIGRVGEAKVSGNSEVMTKMLEMIASSQKVVEREIIVDR